MSIVRKIRSLSLSIALLSIALVAQPVESQPTADSNFSVPTYLPLNYVPTRDVTPPRFLRIEPDGVKNTSDYFDQIMVATNNRVFRFNKLPIPVFIEPNQPDYVSAIAKALATWQLRTGGAIRFVPAQNRANARITVIWSHLGLPADPSSTEFGAHTITEWTVKTGPFSSQKTGSVKPQIIEVNQDVIDARSVEHRVPLLQNLVTHELGHAIGLIGHSTERGDMMFRETDEFSRISQRDLNTLQKIYSRNCDFPL